MPRNYNEDKTKKKLLDKKLKIEAQETHPSKKENIILENCEMAKRDAPRNVRT